ncbi:hypothetical protein [Dapis sp. BLCC M229]
MEVIIIAYPIILSGYVLMTCNTKERLDPAVLRKGRVDLMYEFTYRFV